MVMHPKFYVWYVAIFLMVVNIIDAFFSIEHYYEYFYIDEKNKANDYRTFCHNGPNISFQVLFSYEEAVVVMTS